MRRPFAYFYKDLIQVNLHEKRDDIRVRALGMQLEFIRNKYGVWVNFHWSDPRDTVGKPRKKEWA